MGDVKTYRNLKAHPRSTREALSTRVPRRASENTRHCHVLEGIRDIKRVGRQPWEQDISEMLRRAETERFHRANRYYDALHRVGELLKAVRLRGDKLQATTEEMKASNEELQAITEEMEASNEELEATNEELETTNEELERASTYRQTLMDAMLDILMTTDPRGVITEVNKATEHISGYSHEELVGQPFRQFFVEPDRAQAGIEKVLAGGRVSDYELTVAAKDGRKVLVSYNATVLTDQVGRASGVLGCARDITELKRTEEALRTAGAYNRSLIDASVDPLVMIDPEGKITDVNGATERMTGCSRDELIGTDFSDYFADPGRAEEGYQQAFQEGAVQDYSLEIRHKDGHVTPVVYSASVYRDEKGEVKGVFAAAKDITKRKRMETALARSNEELEQFAYVASHDLQEPLRKIKAFGDRLQSKFSDTLGDEGRDYLERVQSAAVRMETLIGDLLSYSRVTKKVNPTVLVDLTEVVQGVLTDLEVRIKEPGVRVEVGDLPTIEADATQMQVLMRNLIGNALKFHRPEVPPVVKVSSRPVKDLNGTPGGKGSTFHEISVQDNGIGFDEKYLDRIFTIFQRLHARDEYEGSGIGLSLCRKIVERHGGRITARSKPGEGSTFIVTLPAKQPKERKRLCAKAEKALSS